jgi:acyl-coenzyme A thioesterase PaaI-like protein
VQAKSDIPKESLKTIFFRFGINVYPMFYGTGGRVTYLAGDWTRATVRLKLGLRTRNYVGTIFGGSMFAAADPFHMVLLINILGPDFVVWDKAGRIDFKKPGRGRIEANFIYTPDEIARIRETTLKDGSYEFKKSLPWVDQQGDTVSVFEKTIYVATKEFFKQRQKAKAERAAQVKT